MEKLKYTNKEGERTELEVGGLEIDEDVFAMLKIKITYSSNVNKKLKDLGMDKVGENHVTIIPWPVAKEIEKKEKVKEILKSKEWEVKLKDEYYTISKEYELEKEDGSKVTFTKEALIQLVEIPGYEKILKEIQEVTGVEIPEQTLHISIASKINIEDKNDGRGIGFSGKENFISLNPQKVEIL